jgi:hypothetical protein
MFLLFWIMSATSSTWRTMETKNERPRLRDDKKGSGGQCSRTESGGMCSGHSNSTGERSRRGQAAARDRAASECDSPGPRCACPQSSWPHPVDQSRTTERKRAHQVQQQRVALSAGRRAAKHKACHAHREAYDSLGTRTRYNFHVTEQAQPTGNTRTVPVLEVP